MHIVRWLLAVGWLTLIFSLLYDPISPLLTDPNNLSSPFRTRPEIAADVLRCIKIQGECIAGQADAYPMGRRIFWTMILPIGVIGIFVFGHEFWRRICPLYFFSQLPRALKIQRKRKVTNPDTGSVRYELAGVEKESWLGRNYLYLQIGLFFIGLNIRLLFANGNTVAMFIFLIFTIASAITVGYLFKGRSWCQYFCPMAPVQMFYTGPRGLLGSDDAHLSSPQTITQSMCRVVDTNGKEKSACVSCQSPCFDIDAERAYWDGITRHDQKVLYYSYFGLMLGFYVYYFLYSGNWGYYYSGVWTREQGLLKTLLNPGFYLFDQAIPIPKIIAAPLTLAIFGLVSYGVCLLAEKVYRAYLISHHKKFTEEDILHTCFSICTFVSFNVFFAFAGRSNMALFPEWAVLLFNAFIVFVSSLWLYQSLTRSKQRYSRESLADSLRRQLNKLAVDWSKFLEGRALQDLLPDEVYVLAKVIPSFKRSDRFTVYKGVLQEALEEGKVHSTNSLELLKDIRKELNVSDEEHYTLLKELGVENPHIFDTQILRNRENKLRIDSYRRALELMLLELVETGVPLQTAFERRSQQIIALRQEYAITSAEQEQILAQMLNQDGELVRKAEALLTQLHSTAVSKQALSNLVSNPQAPVYNLLRNSVLENQKLITSQIFSILEILGDSPVALNIANSTVLFVPETVEELLTSQPQYRDNLAPQVISLLRQSGIQTVLDVPETTFDTDVTNFVSELTKIGFNSDETRFGDTGQQLLPKEAINDVLLELLEDIDPVIQAASLYALNKINPHAAQNQARQLINSHQPLDTLVEETIQQVLGTQTKSTNHVSTLILQIKHKGRTERRVFQQPIIRVGRASDNDVVILDNRISRQHAIFYFDEKGISVKDLASANGLRVGNQIIRNQQIAISPGDIIRLGVGDDLIIVVQFQMQPPLNNTNGNGATTLEKLLWLNESKLFQGLQPSALIELARDAKVRFYTQGEKICQSGDQASELLVLVDGQAESVTPEAKHIIHSGETIGELNVFSNTRNSATVTARSQTRAVAIEAGKLDTVITRQPILARKLLSSLSSRLSS